MEKIKEIINKILGKPSGSDSSSDNSGFTLIELLIVIAVIGILAAALLVAIDPIDKIRAGNDTKVINDVRSIYDGAQRAYTTSFVIPANPAAVVTAGELQREPRQPGTNAAYGYAAGANTVVVWGTVQSKGNLRKISPTATTGFFVATPGGGCYTSATPNANTLPSTSNPTICQ